MVDRGNLIKSGTSADQMGIYIALYKYANIKTNCIEISINKFALLIDVDRCALQRALLRLEADGLISVAKSNNRHTPTKITLINFDGFFDKKSTLVNDSVNMLVNGPVDYSATFDFNCSKDTKETDSAPVVAPVVAPVAGCSILDKELTRINRRNNKERIRFDACPAHVAPDQSNMKATTPGSRLFDAYSDAYLLAYGEAPVRNARQNSHCAQIVKRLGEDAAILTAQFYLTHRKKWYVENGHSLSALTKDCETLDVQRRKGQMMTDTLSRQIDKDSALDDVFRRFNERHKGERTCGK